MFKLLTLLALMSVISAKATFTESMIPDLTDETSIYNEPNEPVYYTNDPLTADEPLISDESDDLFEMNTKPNVPDEESISVEPVNQPITINSIEWPEDDESDKSYDPSTDEENLISEEDDQFETNTTPDVSDDPSISDEPVEPLINTSSIELTEEDESYDYNKYYDTDQEDGDLDDFVVPDDNTQALEPTLSDYLQFKICPSSTYKLIDENDPVLALIDQDVNDINMRVDNFLPFLNKFNKNQNCQADELTLVAVKIDQFSANDAGLLKSQYSLVLDSGCKFVQCDIGKQIDMNKGVDWSKLSNVYSTSCFKYETHPDITTPCN